MILTQLSDTRLLALLKLISKDEPYKLLAIEFGVTFETFKKYVCILRSRIGGINTRRGLVIYYFKNVYGKETKKSAKQLLDMGSTRSTSVGSK